MKDFLKQFLKQLKKAFGAETDKVPEVPAGGYTLGYSLPPAPKKREEIIGFIINTLQPYVNEQDTGIKGIRLYILCNSREEEILAKVALYEDKPDTFKNKELQRKLLDNHISIEANWCFEFNILHDKLPDCMYVQNSLGLDIIKNGGARNFAPARITILAGQAERDEYILDVNKKQKYRIGRGRNPTLSSGVIHTNDIVFINKEEPGFDIIKGSPNLYISRNHVLILFDPQQKKYFIAVDKGGTPESSNKTKLFTVNDKEIRLDIVGASHELCDGDQIVLGGSAILLFQTLKEEK